MFEQNYRWHEQINILNKSLILKANFLRYIATRSFTEINTLIYLVKNLISSKNLT